MPCIYEHVFSLLFKQCEKCIVDFAHKIHRTIYVLILFLTRQQICQISERHQLDNE